VRNLDRLHAEHPELKVRITLETTAGQGASLGARFEEIAAILAGVKETRRLEVCLDTAHAFAAGYDFSAPNGAEKTFAEFDKVIGLHRLALLHLNDSKSSLGSRVDRHENLGKGKIGLEAFRWMMCSPSLATVPKILETPKGKDLAEDVVAMALLRGFLE
jgi:deoxyribonuclease-4